MRRLTEPTDMMRQDMMRTHGYIPLEAYPEDLYYLPDRPADSTSPWLTWVMVQWYLFGDKEEDDG